MRVIVTGATGFVGRHLLRCLPDRHEVIAVVRDRVRVEPDARVTVVEADLAGADIGARLPDRADAIVHLAQANVPFPAGADTLFAVNAASTQWLAAYALRAGVTRFIYASTGSVYAPTSGPLSEMSPLGPSSFYAATKVVSETILGCYRDRLDVIVLRLFAPYGPGQVDRMIPRLVEAVRRGDPVVVYNGGEPRINPIYVDDLVAVIMQALGVSGPHVVNVAGPRVVSVAEIAALAGEALARKPVLEHRSRRPAGDLMADTSRMANLFKLPELVPPERGIRMLVEAEEAHAQVAR